jgi:hypothetical protein
MAKAFIIHGRDLEARDAVAAFLEAVGLEIISFARAESARGDLERIFDKVVLG